MVAKIGRFAADLNRTRRNATGLTVMGRATPDNVKGRNEAIWPRTMSGDILRTGPMTEEAFEYRMSRWHDPYTQRRNQELAKIKERQGSVFFITAHNCPSQPALEHDDYTLWGERKRPTVIPGFTKGGIPIGVRFQARMPDGSIPEHLATQIPESKMTLTPAMRKIVIEFFRREILSTFPELFEPLPDDERPLQACSPNFPYGGAGECGQMDPSENGRMPGFQLELIRELMFNEVSEMVKGNLKQNQNFPKLQAMINRFITECWPQLEAMMEEIYSVAA